MKTLTGKADAKLSIVLGYIAMFLQCSISIFLTPYILCMLGDSQYGVYKAIGSFIGYLSVLNFGFGDASLRYITIFRTKNEKEKEQEFLSVIFLLTLFFSLLAIMIGLGLYLNLDRIYDGSFTDKEIVEAKKVFLLLIVNIVMAMFNSWFSGIIASYERFSFLKCISIIQYLAKMLLVLALLTRFPYAVTLAVIDCLLTLFIFLGYLYFAFGKLHIHFSVKFGNIKLIKTPFYKEVLGYSLVVFINLILNQIIWNVDSVIISIRLSTTMVTVASVGSTFSSLFFNFSLIFNSVQVPRFVSMLEKSAGKDEIEGYMKRTLRVQSYVVFLIFFGFCTYGREFIYLWVGKGYEAAFWVALTLMIGLMCSTFLVTGQNLLKAMNRQKFYLSLYAVAFLLNCIITWFVVKLYGIIGASVVTMLTYFVCVFMFGIPYFKYVIKIDMLPILREIGMKILPFPVIVFFVGRGLLQIYQGNTWMRLFCHIGIFVVIYAVLIYNFSMNQGEKKQIIKLVKKVIRIGE